jgi:hypothetical protein
MSSRFTCSIPNLSRPPAQRLAGSLKMTLSEDWAPFSARSSARSF